MKYILPLRRFVPAALRGIALCLLVLACRAFADGTPTPTPAPDLIPIPPARNAPAPPPDSGSSATLLRGVTVSPGGTSSEMGAGVVGRVGDMVVTAKELRDVLNTLGPEERAAMAADPALVKRALFSYMVERAILREVDAKKWDQQPAIQAHLDRVRQVTTAELYLKSISDPPEGYPSDAELKKVYETRQTMFNAPHKFLISQIFVSLTPADKAQSKLDDIHRSLAQPGADFAAIAHAKSEDVKGAAQNGSMGWLTDDKMPPLIRYQALLLPKNTPSAPIRLDDGWHIIEVLDSGDVRPLSFDDVKEKLAQQLRTERATAATQAFIDKLLQQNPVTIDDKALPEVMALPGNQDH